MSHDHEDHADIGCIEAIEGLYALLDGEISDPQATRQIEAHVAHCRSCFSRAQVEKLITDRIKSLHGAGSGREPGVPESLQSKLRDILDNL